MRSYVLPIFGFLLFLLTYISCANPITPSGGPKDELPPVLDTLKSFENYQTRFEKSDIELYFDEFINVRNPVTQIVISPPLTFGRQVNHRGKKVKIEFAPEETLKENATYVINFGDAIVDFTEGNVLSNFTLVFSTGDFIDSLSLEGQVKDAFTSESLADILVMLYVDNRDSVVYQNRPYYFAKSDEEGKFKINNLRADTFKLFALRDQNLNYLFDLASEEIGFLADSIILTDTSQFNLEIEIFKEESDPRYNSFDLITRGQIQLNFDGVPEDTLIHILDSCTYYLVKEESNSYLDLWFTPRNLSRLRFVTPDNQNSLDTVSIRIRNVEEPLNFLDPPRLLIEGAEAHHPEKPLEIEFNRPISEIDTSLMTIMDTSNQRNITYGLTRSDNPLRLILEADWPNERNIQFNLLPGFATDLFGYTHDTLDLNMSIGSPLDYGSIEISLVNKDSSTNYFIELVLGEKVIDTRNVYASEDKVTFEKLIPETFQLRVTEDLNANSKWDPGNYLLKRQSENVYLLDLEKLKDNWILSKEIDLSALKSGGNDTQDQ